MAKYKLTIIIISAIILIAIILAFCGFMWSFGPFRSLSRYKNWQHPGNAREYGVKFVKNDFGTPLKDKKILFLGSSVTYGSASMGFSFADYLEEIYGVEAMKEAVSGTTLVDNGKESYVQRIKNNKTESVDILVCQLSTNDATNKLPLGSVSASMDINSFDTSTVAGAIEYIIAYSEQRWGCRVFFFTGSKYNSPEYEKMVELLYEIRDKWGISIIDLWGDEEFNKISDEERKLYMVDPIHPSRAGYLKWWTPKFAEVLIDEIK